MVKLEPAIEVEKSSFTIDTVLVKCVSCLTYECREKAGYAFCKDCDWTEV